RIMRIAGRLAHFRLSFRVVGNDQFEWVEYGDAALGFGVEVVPQGLFEHAVIDARIGLRHAEAFTEKAYGFRSVATTTQTGQGRHAGIVPPMDMAFLHQLKKLAFACHYIT